METQDLYEALALNRISVRVTSHGDSWKVAAHCPYWVNRRAETTWSYSKDFARHEVLAMPEVKQWLQDISGLRPVMKWELH